jgi:ABC-type polysaccharide/polyol phosphate transport system ATPase subunit
MAVENAIEITNVSKVFRLYKDRPHSLKEHVLRGGKGPYESFSALQDVTLNIRKGMTVAFIGKNGSGKSTLLKLINRTMAPSSGCINVNGKVSSLIELGAGFHPDLTGRENIFTNATIFGMNRQEIERKLPEIIAFSELEEFIDNPVRTYSSGMYARLAFSVAIHVDPEILLVDEILSVGDVNFQIKCNNYMTCLQKMGVTIVIVSHDMSVLERLCDYAVWFDGGRLMAEGDPHEIHGRYLEHMANENAARVEKSEVSRKEDEAAAEFREDARKDPALRFEDGEAYYEDYVPGARRWGNRTIVLKNIRMISERGITKSVFHTGERVTLEYDYVCRRSTEGIEAVFGMGVSRLDGALMFGTNTLIDHARSHKVNRQGTVRWTFTDFCLAPGDYSLQVAVVGKDNTQYDYINDVMQFRVISDISDVGLMRIPHEISIDGKKSE